VGWEGRASLDKLHGGMNGDIEKAIAIIEFSRKTHRDWLLWLEKGWKEGSKYLDDKEFHQQCVKDYDLVLRVLRGIKL